MPGIVVILNVGGEERTVELSNSEPTVGDVLEKAGVGQGESTLMLNGRVVAEDDPVADRDRVTVLPKSSKLG